MSRKERLMDNLKQIVGRTANDKPVTAGDDQSERDTMKEEETAVAEWLKKNDAQKYINDFSAQGYYKMASVDNEAIEAIVKERGLTNTLKNSLAEFKKYASGEPMPPPELPPGTELDLSAPQQQTQDGITFRVDKSLSVERAKEAIRSPNNIKPEEWMIIVHGANLLYAYDMDSDEPRYAKTPILDWVVPERNDFVRSEISHARVSSMLTYSEETARYVTSGFDTQTASAGYLFCSASIKRSHSYKTARSSQKKTLVQVGMWKYPRAQIYLDKCTVTADRFKTAIKDSLNADDKKSELEKVFKEYGHVIPTSVLLGGQLCYQMSREIESSEDEKQFKEDWGSSLAAKNEKLSVSIGVAVGKGSDTQTGSVNLEEFSSFTNHGGDSLLCSNPAEWAPTVNVPGLWAVIEMEGMRPTIDLLDDETRQQVIDVWSISSAILDPVEIEEVQDAVYPDVFPDDHKNKALMTQHSGFAVGLRHCSEGSRGSVHLFSVFSDDTHEDAPVEAKGAAYAHFLTPYRAGSNYKNGDNWIESSSICIPLPKGRSFRSMFESESGTLEARLIFVPSNLRFGQWKSIDIPEVKYEHTATEDGFLFVNIHASENGQRGGVKVKINGKEIAGSYVHWFERNGEYIKQQNCCVPVPEGSNFLIFRDPSSGNPDVRASWIPLLDNNWKLLEAETVTLNTKIRAKGDGILHGWIWNTTGGDRGTLKIYTGDDTLFENTPGQLPSAAAAMHYYEPHDRWVKYNSLMLPIAGGTLYKAVFVPSSDKPDAEVYWTAIVPGNQ